MKRFRVLLFYLFMTHYVSPSGSAQPVSAALQNQCLQELRTVLQTGQEWVKVHAAEYLLWLGKPAGVREVYLDELRQYGTKPPYRIGIWRVLAQAAANPAEKKQWTDRIAAAFADFNGPDRIHAAETLAKLGISPMTFAAEAARKAIAGENRALSLYTLWGTGLSDPEAGAGNRQTFLNLVLNKNEETPPRRLGAFILRKLGGLTPAEWQKLAESALSEPVSSGVQLNLVHAALTTAPADAVRSEPYRSLRAKLLEARHSAAVGDQLELATALAETGTAADVPVLVRLLQHENADVRAGAAYAILKINSGKG
ncbi:hypothetical protein [Larkinella soli]|uniref:hypothetical protein n=1 Tax=Larkinella soli TaxID=1770527 RepID=UPI000FFB2FF7|nr:hypothetical protein [Larkinella soli]